MKKQKLNEKKNSNKTILCMKYSNCKFCPRSRICERELKYDKNKS